MDINSKKQTIRAEVRKRKRSFTQQQLGEWALSATTTVSLFPELKHADIILIYASMNDEVDTFPLINLLLQNEKTILLPKVIDDNHLRLIPFNKNSTLKQGRFNILEPEGTPFTDYEKIKVAICPGIAFTMDGKRLGRGGGYYDRLLPLLPNAYKIGLCFHFQVFDSIPTTETDIKMDTVVCNSFFSKQD